MIEQKLKQYISFAFKYLYNIEVEEAKITLEPTSEDYDGDYTFVVFPFLKLSKKKS